MHVESVNAYAYEIPTERPEGDGTLRWQSTGMLIVEVECEGIKGQGYSYTSPTARDLVQRTLADCVIGKDPMDIASCWQDMLRGVRNIGQPGLCATAISAVDIALWDLKSRILKLPLAKLLGQVRESAEVYGSGGFTNWSIEQISKQVEHWQKLGCQMFKVKVGKQSLENEVRRIRQIREIIGETGSIFIDANGAYSEKEAIHLAHQVKDYGVTWFEEPVSSENRKGLEHVRSHLPPEVELSSGEYIYTLADTMDLVPVVDVLQLDVTRCLGITGFLKSAAIAEAWHRPLSTHTAPLVHSHLAVSLPEVRHMELFWDHERIESKHWRDAPEVRDGKLTPPKGTGLGVEFDFQSAEEFRV